MRSMQKILKRWGRTLQVYRADLPNYIALYHDEENNTKGDYTDVLMRDYSTLGRFEYLLCKDVKLFKEYLSKSIVYAVELFERYDNGDSIDDSFISMILFTSLLDALASGDLAAAKQLANHLGGRPEIEELHDDEFVLPMGYILKYFIEDNVSGVKEWLPKLKAACEEPKNKMVDLMGYYLVYQALLDRDLGSLHQAFQTLIEDHIKRCKKRSPASLYSGYFHDSPDADLFVWGIGLLNLCRAKGLDVQITHDLIPKELIIQTISGDEAAIQQELQGYLAQIDETGTSGSKEALDKLLLEHGVEVEPIESIESLAFQSEEDAKRQQASFEEYHNMVDRCSTMLFEKLQLYNTIQATEEEIVTAVELVCSEETQEKGDLKRSSEVAICNTAQTALKVITALKKLLKAQQQRVKNGFSDINTALKAIGSLSASEHQAIVDIDYDHPYVMRGILWSGDGLVLMGIAPEDQLLAEIFANDEVSMKEQIVAMSDEQLIDRLIAQGVDQTHVRQALYTTRLWSHCAMD